MDIYQDTQAASSTVTTISLQDLYVADKNESTDASSIECDICHKIYKNKVSFKNHFYTHSGEYPFHCSVCGKGLISNFRLREHEATHFDDRPFFCDQCGKTFKTAVVFSGHLKSHTDVRTHACTFCNKMFKRRGHLVIHMRYHTDERPYACSVCGTAFHARSNYVEHCKIHDKPGTYVKRVKGGKLEQTPFDQEQYMQRLCEQEVKFTCDVCGQRFSSERRLNTHALVHSEDYPHRCHICSKGFTTKQSMNNHVRNNHTGKLVYNCTKCEKKFATQMQLTKHGIKHTEERTFTCSTCNKAYKYVNDLQRHLQTHTDVEQRRYVCNICSKSYKKSCHLKDHYISSHNGEKDFICLVCFKPLANMYEFTAHMLSHSRPYKCNKCGTNFTKEKSLKKHVCKVTETEASVSVPPENVQQEICETPKSTDSGGVLELKDFDPLADHASYVIGVYT